MSKLPWVERLGPTSLLNVLLIEFLTLVLLLVGYQANWLKLHSLPTVIGGVLPLIVPWGGALGGVCIGLVGVSAHWSKWNTPSGSISRAEAARWNGWYLIRLPLGAALGTIAALIVVLFLGTVGATDNGTINVSPTGAATLMVVAFIVGYQQETFRRMMERVTETLLGPGTPARQPVPKGEATNTFAIEPLALRFETKAGMEQVKTAGITNKGRSEIHVGEDQLAASGDGFSVHGPGPIAAGATGLIRIGFLPGTEEGEHTGSVTVTVGGTTKRIELSGVVT
jgi:hypothetical protein